jgi:hypothetical protein
MGLRASIPPRRAAVVLLVVSSAVSLTISRALAQASAAVSSADEGAALESFPDAARVLLMGDSVMDQQGSAAAFLLRQAGVDARAIGIWGSGLLTVDQYDEGVTKPAGMWLARAKREIARFDPDVVGVYLNHNYWPPYPRGEDGRPITDLWSPAGQRMITQQVRALISILRARGADVFFVSPIPAGTVRNPDPDVWNPIWHGYLPVLRALHVPVADSARPLESAAGLRAETKPACDGTEQRVRPSNDLHLTRFGAGRAGTRLAEYVAALVHANLRDNAAPGDRAAALVPTGDGHGYWLVGCDGSVYHFGTATTVDGARASLAGHGGVVGAVATPAGAGLWIVAADGTIASTGDAPALTFNRRPRSPITGVTGVRSHAGLWATTAVGRVFTAGDAPLPRSTAHEAGVVGIAATPDGRGYWLATADGHVFASGDAHSVAWRKHGVAPVVGIALAPNGRGWWLATADGHVDAAGAAPDRGDAAWIPPPPPYTVVNAAPGPAAGIVAAPGERAGYWVFDTTGRVVARGAALRLGGDNNLALFTQ